MCVVLPLLFVVCVAYGGPCDVYDIGGVVVFCVYAVVVASAVERGVCEVCCVVFITMYDYGVDSVYGVFVVV